MSDRIKTFIIDDNETSANLIASYLAEIEDIAEPLVYKNLNAAYKKAVDEEPKLIFLDVSTNQASAIEFVRKILMLFPSTKIVATSYTASSSLIVKAFKAGVKEFLIKPLIKNDFSEAVSKLAKQIKNNIKENSKCKVITVFSNKGGIGKTAIATNVAYEIAEMSKEKVALIDLNLQLGDISTFLELAPSFNAAYVINNLDKIDKNDILSAFEKYRDSSLYVLSDPQNLTEAQAVKGSDITRLLNVTKEIFSYIIIDISTNFDEKTIATLDNSDLILLPMILNLPSIRNAQRCFEVFKKLNYHKDKIKIIANRVIENDEVKIEDVELALKQPVYFKIPNNYSTIIGAINKGYAVSEINQSSNISKSFRKLAALLTDNFTY
ncbi:AAA family ATPase [bacterium]|nr:AAA family ATPase [bacterium]